VRERGVVGDVNELTSVVRSMVENVSSPTLLMSDVMRSVREVEGSDVDVADLAVPWMTDTPLIPVTSNAVIARTEIFLKLIIFVFSLSPAFFEYMAYLTRQYFRDSTLSKLEIFEKRDNRILIYINEKNLGDVWREMK
jgi:hypothetical protein